MNLCYLCYLFLAILIIINLPRIEGHEIFVDEELQAAIDEDENIDHEGDINIDTLDLQEAAKFKRFFNAFKDTRVPGAAISPETARGLLSWGFDIAVENRPDSLGGDSLVDFISEDHACTPSYADDCRVSLSDNTRVTRHASDLFNKGFAAYSEFSMVPEAYIVNNSEICGSGNHCGDDGKPHADVVQFLLSLGQNRFQNSLNLWKEHHDICYKDWATACDNVGLWCKPYIDGLVVENPETHDYTVPGEFKCYHRSLGGGWLPPGSSTCDDYFVGCPYEFQCRQYSDKFPSDCDGHLDKTDAQDAQDYNGAKYQTQNRICSFYNDNKAACVNHNDDRASNDIEYHGDVDHHHPCRFNSYRAQPCHVR